MWSSQTVVLPERDEKLRGKSIFNVKAEQLWKLFWTFQHKNFCVSRPTKSLCTPGCSVRR